MSAPTSPILSPTQLATLAGIGEERSAPAGEPLYQVGDPSYPFIARAVQARTDGRLGRDRPIASLLPVSF